ncbi:MAG: redoxin domain-containing protein [Bacteroidales bacterium]|jgi:thiol-disulfide isomerase/thioredoxin|nr:redoxin domain-containing protein [Bacteroidales bacterium]
MKRFFLIAAAALTVLAGCKQKSADEVLEAYRVSVEEIEGAYYDAAGKLAEDASLSDEQKEAAAEKLLDDTITRLVDGGKLLLRQYPSDPEIAPAVLSSIYSYLSDDELADILASLGEEVRQSEIVSYLSENLQTKQATAVGKKFVDFTVDHVTGVDKAGNPVYEKKSLSDFVGKGKVMLVDFWSPWCPPCKEEIPNIKAIWEKYHGDDFDVLSVAVWEESRKMDWRNTIDTAKVYGMKWLQLNNGHQEPAALYGIEGIPHMVLFDKDGTILKRGDDLRGAKTAKAVAEVLGR